MSDHPYDEQAQYYEKRECELQEQLDAEQAVNAAQMRDRIALKAEIERLRAALEVQEKFAWLCYQDYGFWGNGGNDIPQMCLLLNDVFCPGADAMGLTPAQVIEVYEVAQQGEAELVWEWASEALQGESDE